jgi:dTDP-4-dehydrorhamnose reductase
MKVLVTGGRGQLGRATARRCTAASHEVVALDVEHLDIRDRGALDRMLAQHRPDVVINAAAYTAVDRAETERDAAFAINATGAGNVAQACEAAGIRALHVSTDYVFDGTASAPYVETDPLAPLGAYGETKAAGEALVLAAGGTVVRTSWLFEAGGPSFVNTMLRLCLERPVLRVVGDQVGCPTWADDLADALLVLAQRPTIERTYHFCNEGVTSWHGFAVAIVDAARTHRPVACERIEAITTAEYPLPARRPAYSVLDTTRIRAAGVVPPSWRRGLEVVVAEVLTR